MSTDDVFQNAFKIAMQRIEDRFGVEFWAYMKTKQTPEVRAKIDEALKRETEKHQARFLQEQFGVTVDELEQNAREPELCMDGEDLEDLITRAETGQFRHHAVMLEQIVAAYRRERTERTTMSVVCSCGSTDVIIVGDVNHDHGLYCRTCKHTQKPKRSYHVWSLRDFMVGKEPLEGTE